MQQGYLIIPETKIKLRFLDERAVMCSSVLSVGRINFNSLVLKLTHIVSVCICCTHMQNTEDSLKNIGLI